MKKQISFFIRIIVAVILIQTLRFKFTAHPDSIYIFKSLGMEPYGRIGTGILELVAGICLIIPKTAWAGALLSITVLFGAVVSHITVLGIEINGDKGLLFFTALITFILSVIILYLQRRDIPFLKFFD
ncbi:DoxX family membrane protein [Aestuariivivens sediminis]|uniref:DoxX family membrane protein n=1 Tax=Aestuariivivens sediminis TaxID=2913557 RepID=UPI001F5A4A99|nr:DoxX family membrane protein [Aestuariivivens sediminis]